MPSLEVMRYRMLMAQRQSFGNRPYPQRRRTADRAVWAGRDCALVGSHPDRPPWHCPRSV